MKQEDAVYYHLLEFGEITSLTAMQRYGIMRLGARIFNLRKEGVPISTVYETAFNRYGVKTRYAKYIMKGQKNESV